MAAQRSFFEEWALTELCADDTVNFEVDLKFIEMPENTENADEAFT